MNVGKKKELMRTKVGKQKMEYKKDEGSWNVGGTASLTNKNEKIENGKNVAKNRKLMHNF